MISRSICSMATCSAWMERRANIIGAVYFASRFVIQGVLCDVLRVIGFFGFMSRMRMVILVLL